ncbi:MAG TPA: DUF4160 domain-containing protein [Thermoanaerobaculia bacterium]|nr:DUF4160 domain-containing protein [Thermoanaerobaculia bacterium]
MPEIARFFGIVIRMYVEAGAVHHQPHFHAYYQEAAAVYGVAPIQLLGGTLPLRQQRMVEVWAALHRKELLRNWELLQGGRLPGRIIPLR